MTTFAHGGEIYRIAGMLRRDPDDLIDFSSNANSFAAGLTARLVKANPYPFLHYPDDSASALCQAIAGHEETGADRILVGNGAAELIWTMLGVFNPRKVLFVGPIFSEYVRACLGLEIEYEVLTPAPERDFTPDSDDLSAIWETDADLIVICNPNNPAAVTYGNIVQILSMSRAPRVLIDSSYKEFLYGLESYEDNSRRIYEQALRPGVSLYTLHSFTKFFCCPGIRLGYVCGERAVLARAAQKRPAWTVSPYAQLMGRAFLENIEAYRQTLPALNQAAGNLARELRRLRFVHPDLVFEGPGFVTLRLKRPLTPAKAADYLQNHLLLVRNCDNIPGMPQGFVRIQARPDKDMQTLFGLLERLETLC